MKEYKNNKELIDYLISKNVIVNDKEKALKNIEKYSYYSIINGYKAVFKDEDNNYKKIPLLKKYLHYMNSIKILRWYF